MEGVKIAAVLEGSDAIGALRKCGVPFAVASDVAVAWATVRRRWNTDLSLFAIWGCQNTRV